MSQFDKKESEDRIAKFMKAYDENVKHYNVALMCYPQFVPSGQSGFNISAGMMPVDKLEHSVPSPITKDELAS
jgi:hypothetical protein